MIMGQRSDYGHARHHGRSSWFGQDSSGRDGESQASEAMPDVAEQKDFSSNPIPAFAFSKPLPSRARGDFQSGRPNFGIYLPSVRLTVSFHKV
jgi:hypothetical protein